MKAFERQTGSPVIVNTSFNVRGEPIVNTPDQAINCFLHTEMDVLVLEDAVLLKEEQPASRQAQGHAAVPRAVLARLEPGSR